MNTTIDQDFGHYDGYLKQIQDISYLLRSSFPKEANPSDLRSENYQKVLELYEKLDGLTGFIKLKLNTYGLDIQEYEFEFFKLKEHYDGLKVDFRHSQLISKKLELAQKFEDERIQDHDEDLANELPSSEDNNKSNAEVHIDEDNLKQFSIRQRLLDKNEAITSKLQHVNRMLHSSLLTSELNVQDLSQSTSALASLARKYSYFNEVLVKSNKLVNTINESSNVERRQIYRTLYLFITVCCWILYKRILSKTIRLALWLVLKIVMLFIWGTSSIVGTGGNRGGLTDDLKHMATRDTSDHDDEDSARLLTEVLGSITSTEVLSEITETATIFMKSLVDGVSESSKTISFVIGEPAERLRGEL